ncbi:DUF6503 family protein [Spongiimicrobium sp. 3-5]|uniref:DUF6503 family protein n=1 Tax=Spongiimicrobium sp. 3-5 TaxID=3332596 RepID=UPI0039813B83
MKVLLTFTFLVFLTSCKEVTKERPTAQKLVDDAIAVSGGDLYENSNISFAFRDRLYHSVRYGNEKVLQREFEVDSNKVVDIRESRAFCRYVNDSLVIVPDTLATAFGNSVNSVHYFANLPFGLNEPAVKKEFLGEVKVKGADYYKIKVTFSEEGGGDDFDDTYVYWFNKNTAKPDYLAYDFHVNGGGVRFREAYNERYVNGIRFVDYKNYKPEDKDASVLSIDSLFDAGQLKLLSKIELNDITVHRTASQP